MKVQNGTFIICKTYKVTNILCRATIMTLYFSRIYTLLYIVTMSSFLSADDLNSDNNSLLLQTDDRPILQTNNKPRITEIDPADAPAIKIIKSEEVEKNISPRINPNPVENAPKPK